VAYLCLVRRLQGRMVQQESLLTTIAQVAVTLAGFSGLVIAIRTTPTAGWHARDTWSLAWMLGTSLGALFLALLPLVLTSFGLSEGSSWTLATMIMSGAMLLFAFAMALTGRRLTRGGHRPRVRYFPTVATCLVATVGLTAGFAAIGVLPHAKVGLFTVGLVTLLLVSALSLVVFLIVLARATRASS
jgi:hypothetical protein